MAKAPENGGMEAMTRLHNGRLLLLTETFAKANGDVLLLERYYTVLGGPAARLRYLSRQSIQPGARLQGKRLVEWQ